MTKIIIKVKNGRSAPQMSHCERSPVVLRLTEDLKEEEVQVHPGITNRAVWLPHADIL